MSSPPDTELVVLFDIDGTLIDSNGAGGGALLSALIAEFDLPSAEPVVLHGRTDSGIVSELLEKHGVQPSAENVTRTCNAYFQRLPAVLESRDGNVLPGVVELLETLYETQSCHLGLLTGNMPASARMKLEHFDLWRFFSAGTYGNQADVRPGLKEPALQMVAEMAGKPLADEQVIVIGDTPLDIELSMAMRSRCLAVCTGGYHRSDLENAGADLVMDDLSDTQQILQWCWSLACDGIERPSKPAKSEDC